MINRNTRRVVVIKDIPSNMIEEAILILKGDPGSKSGSAKGALPKSKKKENDYLIKEAELIINSYIKESKIPIGPKTDSNLKFSASNRKFAVNTVINIALVGSIALFVFLVSRFF